MQAESIPEFHAALSEEDKAICDILRAIIAEELPDADGRIWHRHPVWFLNGNPIVGYSRLKDCVRLMFWSGADFDDPDLTPGTGKFRDASVRYHAADDVSPDKLRLWLRKSRAIQWDYRNLQARKGRLERLS